MLSINLLIAKLSKGAPCFHTIHSALSLVVLSKSSVESAFSQAANMSRKRDPGAGVAEFGVGFVGCSEAIAFLLGQLELLTTTFRLVRQPSWLDMLHVPGRMWPVWWYPRRAERRS